MSDLPSSPKASRLHIGIAGRVNVGKSSFLNALAGHASAFAMVAALWQHGAGMLSGMTAKNIEWQQLSTDEMTNLIAWLNAKK